jgi:hypothetical protein
MDQVKVSEVMFCYKTHPNMLDSNAKSEYRKLLRCVKDYNIRVNKDKEKQKSASKKMSSEQSIKKDEEAKKSLNMAIDKEISNIMLKICSQFCMTRDADGGKGFMNVKIDVKLVLSILNQKMKYSGDMELIDNIMNFNLEVLERSRIAATYDQEAELKE